MAEIIQRYLFNENGEVVGYEYRGRLVRCKDCKWHAERFCNNFDVMGFENDDYCSMAERREDDGKKTD